MQFDKDKLRGLAGTIVFHAILLLVLIFMALRTPLPLPEEAGVEVNLGYSDEGMGQIQPLEPAPQAAASPPVTPRENPDDYLTEDTEETPALKPVVKEKPKPVETPVVKPAPKPQPQPEPQPVVNPNALYKPSQGSAAQGGNEGITGKPGDQGKPTGDPNATGYDGIGGSAGGVSFDLSGRSSRQIPAPPKTFRERGVVVVTIYVNRDGDVTRISAPARGTTTTSSELIGLAERAARQAKFNPKADAAEEQKGTITYIFELN
ncbi:MAG: TonB family protein [Lentimicrobium sp.]|nr:TonB family protein [Lentimicrobium sp.]